MKDLVIYARSWISALSFTLRQTRQRTVCIATLRTSHHKIQPFQRVSGFELMFSKNQFGQLWHDTNRKHNIWWCKVILFNFNIKKTLICLIFLIVQDSLRDQAGLPCASGTRQAHGKAFACAKLYSGAKLYFFSWSWVWASLSILSQPFPNVV